MAPTMAHRPDTVIGLVVSVAPCGLVPARRYNGRFLPEFQFLQLQLIRN
ncbi:hypothetical protein [Pseudolabrys sp. FHR47]|nr:hypothetical protein [Pseudolabrys sp. FHR47]